MPRGFVTGSKQSSAPEQKPLPFQRQLDPIEETNSDENDEHAFKENFAAAEVDFIPNLISASDEYDHYSGGVLRMEMMIGLEVFQQLHAEKALEDGLTGICVTLTPNMFNDSYIPFKFWNENHTWAVSSYYLSAERKNTGIPKAMIYLEMEEQNFITAILADNITVYGCRKTVACWKALNENNYPGIKNMTLHKILL